MKKLVCVLMLIAAMFLLLAGCSGGNAEGEVGMPNPMVEHSSIDDIAKLLGVKMQAPDESTNVKYYLIGDTIGQIDFTLDGIDYTYRGGSADIENMAGIYGSDDAATVSYDAVCGESIVVSSNGDVCVANWTHSGETVQYSLSGKANADVVGALAVKLCDAQ